MPSIEYISDPCESCDSTGMVTAPTPESLRSVRVAAGYTLRDIAHAAGYLTHGLVWAVEDGSRPCPEGLLGVYRKVERGEKL